MQQETLCDIADHIKTLGTPRSLTVRQLLAAIGQKRRGRNVLQALQHELRRNRLRTEPDFWGVLLDTAVSVLPGPRLGRPPKSHPRAATPQAEDIHQPGGQTESADISAAVGAVQSALSNEAHVNLRSSFEQILSGIESAISHLKLVGASSFEKGNYVAAKTCAQKAEELAALKTRTVQLGRDWEPTAATNACPPPLPSKTKKRLSFGKLKKGTRTAQEYFCTPILATLLEMGGRGGAVEVLAAVHAKLKEVLKPADYERLKVKPHEVRWRKAAQWARYTLKQQGYLAAGSPRGIWEITDKGKAHLAELTSTGN